MILRILSILFALPFIQSIDAFAQQTDVLIAEDFESGAAAPDNWRKGSRIEGVKYRYDKKQGFSGKRSLSIEKSAKRYFPIAQWSRKLKHNSGKADLKVTAQIKAEMMTKAVIDATYLDQNDRSISHKWICYIGAKGAGDSPANHEWKEYSGTVEIPEGTEKIELALQVYGPGKVWLDSLKAIYVDGDGDSDSDSDGTERELRKTENMIEVAAGTGKGNYLYVAPRQESDSGNALLIVLPGGDGSAEFHPFVSNIHSKSLAGDFALAQLVAKNWTRSQQIVWPTATSETKKMKYTTEELIEAVIEEVGKKLKLNPKRIYILAWSSGGPAAYAALLQKNTSLRGGVLAMSVFKPNQLPKLKNGKGRSFYILHSQNDRICPFSMAKNAKEMFADANVRTALVQYRGGHGWHGDVFGNIEKGILWLEESDEIPPKQ